MTSQQIIDQANAGNYSGDIRELVAARRATAPATHRERIGRWVVEYSYHGNDRSSPVYGKWTGLMWLAGTTYESERSLGTADTRVEIATRVAEFIRPVEIDLRPLSIGFDPRKTGSPIVVPLSGEITLRLPPSKRHPEGRIDGPHTTGWAKSRLREYGYRVAGDTPEAAAQPAGLDASGAVIES